MSPFIRKIATSLLLLVGVQLWLVVGRGQYGSAPRPAVAAAMLAVASLPFVYRRAARSLERLRHPSPRARTITAAGIFALSGIYLIGTGFHQNRDLFPKLHDEHMYLLQVQMLAHGKLWMPAHSAADSFESFHIFVKPVYASMSFPGTALIYAPMVWFNLPYWLLPALVAAGCAAMLYRVTAELLDSLAGLLAALLLLSLTQFRYLSLMMMSHTVLVLLGLAMVWATLRWVRAPTLGRAAGLGALAGWAAITRPLDAACFAVPVAATMLWAMRDLPLRRCLLTATVIVAAAAPFIALQIVFDVGVTGRALRSPYGVYLDKYTPQISLGFHEFDPSIRPQSNLPQRIAYYDQFNVPAAKEHRPERVWEVLIHERLPAIAALALPSAWLLILLPPALLVMGQNRRWMLAVLIPLFVAAYAMLAYLMPHYVVIVAPAVIFSVLLGLHAVVQSFPRLRAWLTTLGTTIIVVLSFGATRESNRLVADDTLTMPTISFAHRLPSMVKTPAIVLFRFNPSDNPHDEPVYNITSAWPDDAHIIRAHDLTAEQNATLFKYYAQHQPNRRVYRIDRRELLNDPNYRPQYLGTAKELSDRYNPRRP